MMIGLGSHGTSPGAALWSWVCVFAVSGVCVLGICMLSLHFADLAPFLTLRCSGVLSYDDALALGLVVHRPGPRDVCVPCLRVLAGRVWTDWRFDRGVFSGFVVAPASLRSCSSLLYPWNKLLRRSGVLPCVCAPAPGMRLGCLGPRDGAVCGPWVGRPPSPLVPRPWERSARLREVRLRSWEIEARALVP